MNEFKYTLLGLGVVVPGTIALFSNLSTATRSKDICYNDHNISTGDSDSNVDFDEYRYGQDFRLVELAVDRNTWPIILLRMTFKAVVKFLYRSSEGMIICVGAVWVTFSSNKLNEVPKKTICINPSSSEREIRDYVSLFFIARSAEAVGRVYQDNHGQ